ncbi:MAG: hypothetical protein B6U69_02245 [Thermofilum sp. ex4484_15]|nr:MAG: hypothetical protein B6U69_02245 [Thermofilum sp. ex4484_15]
MGFKVLRAFRSYEVVGGEVLNGGRVMDFYSYAANNIIARNPPLSPSVEVRGGWIELLTLEPLLISVGGVGKLIVNGKEVPLWRAYLLSESMIVRLEARGDSVAYLTVHGGLAPEGEEVPIARGSSLIPLNPHYTLRELKECLPALYLPERYLPRDRGVLEFVPLDGVWERGFFADKYTLARKLLRRGYLLIASSPSKPLEISEEEYFRPGSLAVRGRGEVLVPLSPTEGKFPKLGELTPESMDYLARLTLRAPIKLKPISLDDGESRISSYTSKLAKVEKVISAAMEAVKRGAKKLKVRVKGKLYEVWIEELG